MNSIEFGQWAEQARAKARTRMAAAAQAFGLGAHARYQIDLPSATMTFLDQQGREQVQARLQVAGSWSPRSESWLWGWQNESVPEPASSRLLAVRELGQREGVERLTSAFTGCEEADAWTMASLAADVLDAECIYRAGGAKSQLFLLLFDIRKAD